MYRGGFNWKTCPSPTGLLNRDGCVVLVVVCVCVCGGSCGACIVGGSTGRLAPHPQVC